MGKRFGVGLGLVFLASVAVQADVDAQAIWESIGANSLDFERAVSANELSIDMGAASLTLHTGLLIPARQILGRTTELVFVGEAEFTTAPADELEKKQLELFTGSEAIKVAVQRAVLVIGQDDVVQSLLDREPVSVLDDESRGVAENVYSTWVTGAVRRGFGADGAQLRTLVGDRLFDGFFLAWCETVELGEFYYALDPGEAEQITLGQFVPIELDDREAYRLRKALRKQQRKGRFAKLNIEDLGDWDTWMSMSRIDSSGSALPGGSGFESEHYTIEVTLQPADQTLQAVSRTRVRAEWGNSRVLTFDLFRDIDVTAVKGVAGDDLPWIHTDDGLLTILPEPLEAGATTEVVVEYGGVVLQKFDTGTYVLMDTSSWYPRIGDVDRATYDVKLTWPKRHELLASGRVVESGSDAGMTWERRELAMPAIAFSFEVGSYDVRTMTVGHVDMTVAFSKVRGALRKGARQATLDHLSQSLEFFEEMFGAYPLDYLSVTTVPRGFSQGYLGFVTLSHFLLIDRREDEFIETVAHELSHQWWGNKVGWDGYRDQWLSEALADFSAMLYTTDRATQKSVHLARHARGWKRSLLRQVSDGRTVESLGPVVMGSRLSSSKSSSAYQSIVYQKGSVILNMLAQALGPEPFAQMLKSLANNVNNRVIDTRTFLRSIERMSGANLEQFERRFVYGTGIPEIYYTYEFVEQDDGTWTIVGEARQVTPGRFDYVLQKTDGGTWHVAREHTADVNVEQSAIAVPFQISLAARKDENSEVAGADFIATQRGLGGRLVLQGEQTEFSIPIPERPEKFWFDQRGEVLVSTYSELEEPKRMLRYRAIELANAKRFGDAEELYRKALGAPLYSEAAKNPPSKKDIERSSKIQDALIHIALTRMYIDMEHDADAAAELDHVDELLKGRQKAYYETSRMVLRCHLAIRAGEYEKAYREMEKSVYLKFPFRYEEKMGESSRRRKFSSRGRSRLNGLGYALFAVAAHEAGQVEVARQAAKEATKRSAFMRPLDELLDADS